MRLPAWRRGVGCLRGKHLPAQSLQRNEDAFNGKTGQERQRSKAKRKVPTKSSTIFRNEQPDARADNSAKHELTE